MENIHEKLSEIEALIRKQQIFSKEILTLEESSEYLGLSKSAIYKLTGRKEIPYYCPGGKKIYFKKSELNEWVFKAKILSDSEVISEIEVYLKNNS